MVDFVLVNDIIEGAILSANNSTDILSYDTSTALRGSALNGATFSITSTILGYDPVNKLGAGGRITSFFTVNEGIVQIGLTNIDIPLRSNLTAPVVTFSHIISDLSVILRVSGIEGGQMILWRGKSEIIVIQS